MFYLLLCQFSFFFFPFPIFKDTIYIRVPQRTDPLMFTLHLLF